MKLLYGVSQLWILYLNRYVAESASEVLETPGANIPFLIAPFLHYVGQSSCPPWRFFSMDRDRPAALVVAVAEAVVAAAAAEGRAEERATAEAWC